MRAVKARKRTKNRTKAESHPNFVLGACRNCGRIGLLNKELRTCAAPEDIKDIKHAFKRVHYCQRVLERKASRARK